MPSSVTLNEQFKVQINASGLQNLHNAVYSVTYDPKKLAVVTQAEGDLLKQNNSRISFQAFAANKTGKLWISMSRLNNSDGASGSGVLATVTFKAIGKGAAGIGFENTNLSTKAGVPIPVMPFKSVVEVK